jgi:hypothetical protein
MSVTAESFLMSVQVNRVGLPLLPVYPHQLTSRDPARLVRFVPTAEVTVAARSINRCCGEKEKPERARLGSLWKSCFAEAVDINLRPLTAMCRGHESRVASLISDCGSIAHVCMRSAEYYRQY